MWSVVAYTVTALVALKVAFVIMLSPGIARAISASVAPQFRAHGRYTNQTKQPLSTISEPVKQSRRRSVEDIILANPSRWPDCHIANAPPRILPAPSSASTSCESHGFKLCGIELNNHFIAANETIAAAKVYSVVGRFQNDSCHRPALINRIPVDCLLTMHEMSIAMEVCGIAERHVGRDKLATVLAVGLEVGDKAGVEIDNLEFCLEVLLSEAPFGKAKPAVRRVEGNVLRVSHLEVADEDPDD